MLDDDIGAQYPNLRSRRQALRRDATPAESLLWRAFRDRQVSGVKFRRQQQLGPFIADFYCRQAGLVVELDGSQHYEDAGIEYDARRTAYLESRGLRVIRVSNTDVLSNLAGVVECIWGVVERGSPDGISGASSPPSP